MRALVREPLGGFLLRHEPLQIQHMLPLPLPNYQHVDAVSPLVAVSRFSNHGGYVFPSHRELRWINPPVQERAAS